MLIKISRFVFVINAIIGSRFVSITTTGIANKTLCKQIYIVIIIITIRTIKAETGEEKERGAERETYLGMRRIEPLLRYPGFNALFYTTCPGVTSGHQPLQYDRT